MCDKENIVYTRSLTRECLHWLRLSRHIRLNNAAWRAACEAGVALHRSTHRGTRGGALKRRFIRVIVSVQSTMSAKPILRVHHHSVKIIKSRTTIPSLKLVLMNTRYVCNKVSVISETLLDADADVSFLAETWLRDEHQDFKNDLTLPRFEFKKLNRSVKRGGGLGVLHISSLKLVVRTPALTHQP